ncbi:hypothetical protein ACFSTC_05360 [Nonomuraea ferruginea]
MVLMALSLSRVVAPNSSESLPSGHMAAEVHLPVAVLGVHEALGHEEVFGGVGVDVRDSVFITINLHIPG